MEKREIQGGSYQETLVNLIDLKVIERYGEEVERKVIPRIMELQVKKDKGAENVRRMGVTFRSA